MLPAPKETGGHERVLLVLLEQATRIELATTAWEADVLPLNYACLLPRYYTARGTVCQEKYWEIFLFPPGFIGCTLDMNDTWWYTVIGSAHRKRL